MSIWTIIGALWIWKMCEKWDAADDRRAQLKELKKLKPPVILKPTHKKEPTQTVYRAGKWVEESIYAK